MIKKIILSSILVVLSCMLFASSALAHRTTPTTAPQADGRTLIGYDSPQFRAKQYAYVDTNGHIEELSVVAGGRWVVADLSARTGAPRAANGITFALVGYDSPQFHAKQYAYVDTNGHIEELYIVAGGQWQVADLTARTGAPRISGYALAGYNSPQFQAKQYAYVDTNGHIEELYIVAGSQWQVADLTARTGAPQGSGTLAGYDSPQFQAKQYTYVDTNWHVEELYIVAGSQWQVADLTARTGAPQASGQILQLAGYDSPQFQAKQYAYVDTNGHIEELYIVAGGQWQVADLSAGAPLDNGALAGYDSPQFQAKQYAYVDTNGHIEELYIVAGSQWQVADLSGLT